MAIYKPQSPIEKGEHYIYPLTTHDQVILPDGSRWSGSNLDVELDGEAPNETGILAGYSLETLKTYILDLAHPIGSYYWSSEETNPSILFGGNWEQIKDTFILAAGDSYAVGETGGEATHTLTVDEMPNHDHNVSAGEAYDNLVMMAAAPNLYGVAGNATGSGDWKWNKGVPAQGGSQPHNNMPPYLVAYCWRRVS